MECVSSLLTEPLLEAQLNGVAHAPANSHSSFWPHGHFRCVGDDAWLAVAVRTDGERDRLVELLGLDGGDAHELVTALSDWIGQRTREDATQILMDAGIPAAPLRTYEDLQLVRRTSAMVLTHPYCGEQIVGAIPWQVDGTELLPLMRGPLLGEHTDEVLTDLIGMDETEIEALRHDGVLSPRPVALA
jgi:crotonobetainyl-CoA:carnitine CoA-transferase CaiB-like acyl-CoA transferase